MGYTSIHMEQESVKVGQWSLVDPAGWRRDEVLVWERCCPHPRPAESCSLRLHPQIDYISAALFVHLIMPESWECICVSREIIYLPSACVTRDFSLFMRKCILNPTCLTRTWLLEHPEVSDTLSQLWMCVGEFHAPPPPRLPFQNGMSTNMLSHCQL